MKKICLLSIALILVCAANAQTEFTVPTPTTEQKFNWTKMVMNNSNLSFITVAKNEGITAEELGKKIGAIFVPVWDENGGFEPFVNFMLRSWACYADSVQIIEQSDEKLVVMYSSMYKPLENQGVLFGSSVEDYITYYNAMWNEIAVHYNRSIEMTRGEKGYRIVITR